MSECSVKLVVEPWDVAIWITENPVPGDHGSPDCGPQEWPDESQETTNGQITIGLECGARYCVKYRRPALGDGASGGTLTFYCDGSSAPFERLPFQIKSDGSASGQQCFVVLCEEEA